MEDSQPVSVESFSYAWLVNQNPSSLHSPNRSFRLSFDGASFIEMDPYLITPSKRFLVNKDFDFNVPKSQPHMTLVHADKLISNGFQVPLKSYSNSNIPVSPISSTTREEGRFRKSRSMSFFKCNKLQKTIIQKYIDLVRPLWCRMRLGRSGSTSRVQGVENQGPSSKTSGVCWGARCCDSESSIYEAVVHCKKTIGMD